MHDLLFENQKTWHEQFDARPTFEGYAEKIGLDMERFRRDVSSQVVEQRIFLDGKRAHALGVKGTPTVFLNGREVPFESLAPEKLRVLINVELTRKVRWHRLQSVMGVRVTSGLGNRQARIHRLKSMPPETTPKKMPPPEKRRFFTA